MFERFYFVFPHNRGKKSCKEKFAFFFLMSGRKMSFLCCSCWFPNCDVYLLFALSVFLIQYSVVKFLYAKCHACLSNICTGLQFFKTDSLLCITLDNIHLADGFYNQDPPLFCVLRELEDGCYWICWKGLILRIAVMKEGPRSSHGSYWFLVHYGITVSVCAYITGEVFILLLTLPNNLQEPCRAVTQTSIACEKWILVAMVFIEDGIITA